MEKNNLTEKRQGSEQFLRVAKIAGLLLVITCTLLSLLAMNVTFAADVDTEAFKEMMGTFISIYNKIIMPTLSVLGIMVFAIAGFSNFLKLKSVSDDGEREKAKKAIIWWLIGVVGAVAVLWAVPNLIAVAQGWFGGSSGGTIPGY